MHIFLDCDGVLADFDAHVQNCFGFRPREVPDEEMWRHVHAMADFWLTIPKKHGAEELFQTAMSSGHPVSILTGCPRTGGEVARDHKPKWVAANISPTVPVITCLSREKQSYMTAPGDILVDDFVANIKRWDKAGGRAIYYKTAYQATRDLAAALSA